MVAAVKMQLAMGSLGNGNGGTPLNFATDTLKLVLSNTVPLQAWNYYSSLTSEVANGNGYTTGGAALTSPGFTNASGTWSCAGTPGAPTWTSSTGNMGPFQWITLVDTTPAANKVLLAYWDNGSSITLNGVNGDTFAVTFSTANVPFTLA